MHNAAPHSRAGWRLAAAAAAVVSTIALTAPAGARAQTASPIAVDASTDSVIVTGLPFGQTTLQVTRPDLKTGTPVVIGQFQGFAFPTLPFSANTTIPTLLNPGGDCWQPGGLSLPGGVGLTPDMLPGDTISVVGGPSTTVAADAPSDETDGGTDGGPIAGCQPISMWGRNAVTAATFDADGNLAVSGVAQPLATSVGVTATDSNGTATPAVAVTPAASDGSWTATIPADSLGALADGSLTVGGDYAVPDVSTGAPADIAGVTVAVDKQTPAPAPSASSVAPAASAVAAAPKAAAPAARPFLLSALRVPKKISLKAARDGKLSVSFVVPTGAKLVRIRLSRPGRTALLIVAPAARAGTRQTVALKGAKMSKLVASNYRITLGAGATRADLGSPVLRADVRVS